MAQQLTVRGIISYPHLFQPRAVNPGDDPKYSVTCLIHKQSPHVAEIQAAINTEKANGFPSGFPPAGKVCLKDCAVTNPGNPDLADYYELRTNSSADNKPHVVDMNCKPAMDQSKVRAGDYAWFSVNIASYSTQVNKGVGCYINGVMVTGEEGPLGRLDNKPSAEQMFAGVAQGQQAAPTQGTNAAPPPPAPNAPKYQMTTKATCTREEYHAAGWTDEQLIQHGLMLPPNGVQPSFA